MLCHWPIGLASGSAVLCLRTAYILLSATGTDAGFCGALRIAPVCLFLHVLGRSLGHVGPGVCTCLRRVWTFLHLRASLHLGCQRQLPIVRFCSSARLTALILSRPYRSFSRHELLIARLLYFYRRRVTCTCVRVSCLRRISTSTFPGICCYASVRNTF